MIPPEVAATADRPPRFRSGYEHGGVLPPGPVLLRNDTGRNLGPDELHLLTYVGAIPQGADPQTYAHLMSFRAGERLYTRADVERYAAETTRRFLDEIASGTDVVNTGRAVPASPVVDPAAPVTLGFDGTAGGRSVVVANAEGRVWVVDTDTPESADDLRRT